MVNLNLLDTFRVRSTLALGGKSYRYCSLSEASRNGLGDLSSLPYSLRVLLENLLRHEDGKSVTDQTIKEMVSAAREGGSKQVEVSYYPAGL